MNIGVIDWKKIKVVEYNWGPTPDPSDVPLIRGHITIAFPFTLNPNAKLKKDYGEEQLLHRVKMAAYYAMAHKINVSELTLYIINVDDAGMPVTFINAVRDTCYVKFGISSFDSYKTILRYFKYE